MNTFTDIARERVAVAAAIGAGCQPCTQHHVREALRTGLSATEIGQIIGDAESVRWVGSDIVVSTGRRLLDLEPDETADGPAPATSDQALAFIGAAAGCNAGSLVARYIADAHILGLSDGQMRAALEAAAAVKRGAAMFLDREIERALRPAERVPAGGPSEAGCCGPTACEA